MTATSTTAPPPDAGVYINVSSEEYHNYSGVLSKSALWAMVIGFNSDGSLQLCPAKFRYDREHPRKDTDALVVGDALDCLLLEPHEFDQRFIMSKSCEAPKKKGSDEVCGSPGKVMVDGQWRCGTHGRNGESIPDDKSLLDHIQMSTVRGVARSINDHPIAGPYFTEPHEAQMALVGTVFGRRMKGRFDLFRRENGVGTIVDLKSARNPQPHLFIKDAIKYGYHVQCFNYSVLGHQHGLIDEHGCVELIVAGKSAIYGCGRDAVYPIEVYTVPDDVLMLGYRHLEQLVSVFDYCDERGEWPVRLDEPTKHVMTIPRWMNHDDEGEDFDE